ncbi:chitin deacetylase 9 [Moniliophthora roreri]|nr:chitin deacetylase 9 [Moniliophthora roreri]
MTRQETCNRMVAEPWGNHWLKEHKDRAMLAPCRTCTECVGDDRFMARN